MREAADQHGNAAGGSGLVAAGAAGCVVLLAFLCMAGAGGGAILWLKRSPEASVALADADPPEDEAPVEDDTEPLEEEAPEDEAPEDEAPEEEPAAPAEEAEPPPGPGGGPPRRRPPKPVMPVLPEPEPEPEPPPPPPPPVERPKEVSPDPGRGAVQFEIADGDAATVLANGSAVASLSPNRKTAFVQLDPGTHKIVIKDLVSGKVVHRGTLEISEGRVVRVAFGLHTEPRQVYGPPDAWRGK